ncbi:MAG TPA: MFS transporter [Pedomonas sp.]|uniref:MFS transporter n=1 Tax=Pedomonas sp. TaxID=2976421 RepID=UPI002F410381
MRDQLRPLRQPVFAMLWSATVLANLGFWLQDITMSWLMADLTVSPAQIALLPVATQLPIFLLSLPAGALADRTDLRRFLLTTQTLMIMLILGFAATLAFGAVSIGTILLFAFASGTLMAISAPARQAVLPSIVEQQDIRAAVMLSAIGYNASRAVGPMIGGILLAIFGPFLAMLSYAGSCILVGLALLNWRPTTSRQIPSTSFAGDMMAGTRHVLYRADLRSGLLATFVFFLLVSPVWAFLPLIAKGYAKEQTEIFSLFLMAIGTGAVIGGFIKKLTSSATFSQTLRNGVCITAVGMALIAGVSSIALSLLGFFIVGLGWIAVGGGINAFVLTEADAAYRARAISFVMIIFAGGLSLGSLLWGQAARHIGANGAMLAGGALLCMLAAYVHFRPLSPSRSLAG